MFDDIVLSANTGAAWSHYGHTGQYRQHSGLIKTMPKHLFIALTILLLTIGQANAQCYKQEEELVNGHTNIQIDLMELSYQYTDMSSGYIGWIPIQAHNKFDGRLKVIIDEAVHHMMGKIGPICEVIWSKYKAQLIQLHQEIVNYPKPPWYEQRREWQRSHGRIWLRREKK